MTIIKVPDELAHEIDRLAGATFIALGIRVALKD